MALPKILLFYRFTPIADPEAVRLWQLELCERLGLRGRIIVSPHGINATLGGALEACKAYLRATKRYAPLHELDVKWSAGTGLDEEGRSLDFPRLSVKTRPELVAFGAPELAVEHDGVVGGGGRLSPEEVDAFVEAHPDAVFFDGRNRIEAEVGRFEGAVVPDVVTTHDFLPELDSGRYDHLKQRPVITYCTGGVRCEILSRLMRDRGFEQVYQLDGGIVRYLERYGSTARWQGALTVFDARETVSPEGAEPIASCHSCGAATSTLVNCADLACRVRLVTCAGCASRPVGCESHRVG